MQYSSQSEISVCSLASVCLPTFVGEDGEFDFSGLHQVVKVVTANLNRVIDSTHYPVPEARLSSLRHRPIGIGVQGLADTFTALSMSYASKDAEDLDVAIFETIYHAALEASVELAARQGPHDSWSGSPASKGILQYDMWGVTPSLRWDWEGLKANMSRHGLRNSLLVAPMPTAGTSQIFGFSECFDPIVRHVDMILFGRRLTDLLDDPKVTYSRDESYRESSKSCVRLSYVSYHSSVCGTKVSEKRLS